LKPAQKILLAAGISLAQYLMMPDAWAQTVSAADFARCTTITADAERLSCYDQLGRSVPSTVGTPPTAAPPVRSFGMTKPPADRPPEPSRMEAKVREVTDARAGIVLQLDNDQTWVIDELSAIVRTGDAVVIKRAALGSFMMSTPTNRVYRVRRLR